MSLEDVAEQSLFSHRGMSAESYQKIMDGSSAKIATKSALDKQIGGQHYKNLKIQPATYCYKNDIPFIEGSIIKYVTRWRNKNGVADLEKAQHFLEILIELEKKNASSS